MVQDSPGSGQDDTPLAPGEDWKKRFDGLMSASQRREESYRKEIEASRGQVGALQSRIAGLEARMSQQVTTNRQAMLDTITDPEEKNAAQLKVMQDELGEIRGHLQWVEQQRQLEFQQRVALEMRAQHIKNWTDKGVPQEELDLSSPEAMRASALEWLADRQREDLEETKKELRGLKGREQQVVEEAEARTREELGATRVMTSQGRPPASQSERERLETELAHAIKDRNTIAAWNLKRQLAMLPE